MPQNASLDLIIHLEGRKHSWIYLLLPGGSRGGEGETFLLRIYSAIIIAESRIIATNWCNIARVTGIRMVLWRRVSTPRVACNSTISKGHTRDRKSVV